MPSPKSNALVRQQMNADREGHCEKDDNCQHNGKNECETPNKKRESVTGPDTKPEEAHNSDLTVCWVDVVKLVKVNAQDAVTDAVMSIFRVTVL